MKIVKIKKTLYQLYKQEGEMMQKEDRPCVLIIKLNYKDHKYDFAVPMRSNIAPNTPKSDYFALPNRHTTKPHHHHGIHFAKMFPVNKSYFDRYRTDGNMEAAIMAGFIDKNEKKIVSKAQSYLDAYAAGQRSQFATDIDLLLSFLYPEQ